MNCAPDKEILKKFVAKVYRMTKPGGMFLGAKVNHNMTPEEFERTRYFGLVFEKTSYQDGEVANF
jgi:hypothetical protein